MRIAAARIALVGLALTSLVSPALAQSTKRVSVDASGQQLGNASVWPSLSRDGRFAAFVTDAPNLDPNDHNGTADVFVKDLATGQIVRASVTVAGVEANGPCFQPLLSSDGRYVAFTSWATNLAASDANGSGADIFVKDLQTGVLTHASVNSAGQGGNDISAYASFSADGRFVTFYSYATNLVVGDTNDQTDVFLHDVVSGATERISSNNGGGFSSVSSDGRFVAFEQYGAITTIAVRDRLLGTTKTVSTTSNGSPVFSSSPVISDDGRYVAFATAFNLIDSDQNSSSDVYRVEVSTGKKELATPGTAAHGAGLQFPTSMSADARFITITSANSYSFFDSNAMLDVYVADMSDGGIELMSWAYGAVAANDNSGLATISADGRYVCFLSEATNVVPNDTNGAYDVFLRDRCHAANWTNLGAGFPGTGGVPSLTLSSKPVLGSDCAMVLATMGPNPAFAIGLVGTLTGATPTVYGGLLYVAPVFSIATFAMPQGTTIPFSIPNDIDLCNGIVTVQFLLADTGAAHGVAFTKALLIQFGA